MFLKVVSDGRSVGLTKAIGAVYRLEPGPDTWTLLTAVASVPPGWFSVKKMVSDGYNLWRQEVLLASRGRGH